MEIKAKPGSGDNFIDSPSYFIDIFMNICLYIFDKSRIMTKKVKHGHADRVDLGGYSEGTTAE